MYIVRYGQIHIYVFPDDHTPVHCHVYLPDDRHVKVTLPNYEIEVISGKFRIDTINEIKLLVDKHKNEIGRMWRKYHGN